MFRYLLSESYAGRLSIGYFFKNDGRWLEIQELGWSELNQKVLSVVYLKTASRCTTIYVYSWSQRIVHFQEVDLVLCSSGARIRTRGAICTLLQVRIQDLVKGGPQVLRPKVADVAKRSRASEVSNLRPGSRARLRALEAFGFLMLKYAFSHILETLFL